MNSHELALAMLEGRVRGEEQPNFARRPPSYESDVSALSEGERQNAREVEATEWAVGRMLGGGGERWVGSDAHPGLGRPRR